MTHILNKKNIKHYLENKPKQFRIYDIKNRILYNYRNGFFIYEKTIFVRISY